MDILVLVIFCFVYLGMILGRIPGLALDRTGLALLGAIGLVIAGRVSLTHFAAAVDMPTIMLLFGLMVISAQFRLSGFYSHLIRHIAKTELSPPTLLALIIGAVGLLSAVLANDIVCLAVAPVLIEACDRRQLDPKPFLLALACAANVGSAATLIGNPQNILIGQILHLSFSGYLWDALIPSVLGLALVWLIINRFTAGKWHLVRKTRPVESPPHSNWQTSKGLIIVMILVVMFLASPWPREIIALAAAGILLCSRRMRSREMLGLVDWQLLVLFISLFVVNYAFSAAGYLDGLKNTLVSGGVNPDHPAALFGISVVLSNIVSNVPAVMLLLPTSHHLMAGSVLALSSTLAGNLFIVGSIANIIVIDQASRLGIHISWREHARIGIPVTLATLAVAGVWLWIRML
ncbi:MAG: anion transporter [candidate division Zixibacteria bacterium HGW-Zixibacteria-1]|nr:MAG: anion transporter [candidate division Zixibacteria bacterium HGW-Zixibacteria-1]